MNIQEREEMNFGDGYANESDRLFAVERLYEAGVRINRERVNLLAAFGFYSVIAQHKVYGSNTDAYLGFNEELVLVTRCLDEVEDFTSDEFYEYVSYEVVYPEAPNGGN